MASSRKNPLKARLSHRLSKQEVGGVIADIFSGKLAFSEIRPLLFHTDPGLLFNLYWVLATIANRTVRVLEGLETDIFKGMIQHAANESVVRSCLSVFKQTDIPESIEDELYEFCFRVTESADSPIAHRSFAMVICARICKKYPELAGELLPLVRQVEETYG
ncbi:MAG: hypothetical protein LRY55_04760, partial [Leadbetterella sp.]|nr:hypothetical protein [Leadbetterella sp.]